MFTGRQISIQHGLQKRPGVNDRRVLSEQIFEVLQQSIIDGELRPNLRLIESDIAEKLGVSRTPVREALMQLAIAGYASPLPGGGLAVVDHSDMQIQSLFEIREALECMAVMLSCQHITDEQIRMVEEYYTRSNEAMLNRDTDEYVKLHRAFHETLYGACGNEQLKSLIHINRRQFFDQRLNRMYTLRERHTQIKQHGQILGAVRERNARWAGKFLQRHLRDSLKIALQRL
jgi:DNA-binding GntR family transcriptional regulator